MTPEQIKLLLDIKFLAEQLQHETTLSKVNQILDIEVFENRKNCLKDEMCRIPPPNIEEKWSITAEGNLERNKGDFFPTFGSHIINSELNKAVVRFNQLQSIGMQISSDGETFTYGSQPLISVSRETVVNDSEEDFTKRVHMLKILIEHYSIQ